MVLASESCGSGPATLESAWTAHRAGHHRGPDRDAPHATAEGRGIEEAGRGHMLHVVDLYVRQFEALGRVLPCDDASGDIIRVERAEVTTCINPGDRGAVGPESTDCQRPTDERVIVEGPVVGDGQSPVAIGRLVVEDVEPVGPRGSVRNDADSNIASVRLPLRPSDCHAPVSGTPTGSGPVTFWYVWMSPCDGLASVRKTSTPSSS